MIHDCVRNEQAKEWFLQRFFAGRWARLATEWWCRTLLGTTCWVDSAELNFEIIAAFVLSLKRCFCLHCRTTRSNVECRLWFDKSFWASKSFCNFVEWLLFLRLSLELASQMMHGMKNDGEKICWMSTLAIPSLVDDRCVHFLLHVRIFLLHFFWVCLCAFRLPACLLKQQAISNWFWLNRCRSNPSALNNVLVFSIKLTDYNLLFIDIGANNPNRACPCSMPG